LLGKNISRNFLFLPIADGPSNIPPCICFQHKLLEIINLVLRVC
jgi:hypothetical protein